MAKESIVTSYVVIGGLGKKVDSSKVHEGTRKRHLCKLLGDSSDLDLGVSGGITK